jgi:hypothetical protein
MAHAEVRGNETGSRHLRSALNNENKSKGDDPMEFETLTTMNEDVYRVAVMLLEGFALIVGLASAMFVIGAMLCAAWDSLVEMGRTARAQMKPAPEAHSYEAQEPLASLEYAFDSGASRRETSPIQ